MCGVSGYYSINSNVIFNDAKNCITAMTSCLQHRGPDAMGIFYDDNIGLGHQRLSIMDLSDAGNQPMESHSKRYICVYNGEVYNFKQIEKEFDIIPRTGTDTEIIIETFEKCGIEFVNKLIGMFVISIYDRQEHVLYLFRDRLGIKPLFYYWNDGNFAFASELKSLLTVEKIKQNAKINKNAIGEYLHLGYIPQPDTIFDNIFKFPSGSYGVVSKNGLKIETYWNVKNNISTDTCKDFSVAKNELRNLLEASISMRLMSDVPFGTFLSGGIDSSLVTAIASKSYHSQLKTFSIGFKDNKHDESQYARKVAQTLKTDHTEYIVTEDDAKEMIVSLLDFYDEPYSDSSAIPTMLLSKLAKEQVTMALSGDGGDELFMGYGAYLWAKRLNTFPVNNLCVRKTIAFILNNSKSNRNKRAAKLFDYNDKCKLKSHIFSQEQFLFSEYEISKLLTPQFTFDNNIEQNFKDYARKLSPEEEQAIFDINYYLKDDLLVKVDRASMKYALEVRVPLLDHRIVEFALNLDKKLKINNGTQKYLLKNLLYDYLPAQIFDRPKWGFSIPLKKWLYEDLSFLIDSYLNKATIEKYNIVKYDVVEKYINGFKSGKDFLYNRLWQLIILHKFLIKTSQP